jgi:hypothetical protein
VHVGAGYKMGDANMIKEGSQFVVFTTPICLHTQQFMIKKTLNMSLEVMKFLKDIRLMFKEIDPCELGKIINE